MQPTTRTLVAIRKTARAMMDDHGFHAVPFRWNTSRRNAGAVYFHAPDPLRGVAPWTVSHLTLSRTLIPTFTDEAIRETILHEIAHLMAPDAGHGPAWREAALSIGSTAERCWSYDAIRPAEVASSFA